MHVIRISFPSGYCLVPAPTVISFDKPHKTADFGGTLSMFDTGVAWTRVHTHDPAVVRSDKICFCEDVETSIRSTRTTLFM